MFSSEVFWQKLDYFIIVIRPHCLKPDQRKKCQNFDENIKILVLLINKVPIPSFVSRLFDPALLKNDFKEAKDFVLHQNGPNRV